MSLHDRFELQRLVRKDGFETYEGVERATGRPILAHLFVNPQAVTTRVMLDQIGHLSAADLRRVIDRGQHEGNTFIITDRLADYPGLSEFLAARTGRPKLERTEEKPSLSVAGAWKVVAPQPPAPPQTAAAHSLDEQFASLFESSELPVAAPKAQPVATPKPEANPPGEFTRMFQAPPQRPANAPPVAPAAAPPQPQAPPPGEFTRMFQAASESRVPGAGPAPLAQSTPQPPGEFTRMFQSQAQRPANQAPPVTVPPQPASLPQGEFTQMLQASTATPTPASPPASPPAKQPGEFTQMLQAPAPKPPADPAKPGPGEFTRFFQHSPSDPLPATPAMQQPLTPQSSNPGERVGEFTRVFGTRDVPAPPPNAQPITPVPTGGLSAGATQTFATPSVPPPVPSPMGAAPRGPGEYTQMFSVPATLTLGQTPPASAPAPESSKPANSRLPLILGISAGVILILALVLYLLLRSR